MVHSTWGEWFVRSAIEGSDPAPGGLDVWYVGCNGFVLRTTETTVYVDPYFGDGSPPRLLRMDPVPVDPSAVTECDAVLVTHEHLDHMHPPSYRPLVCGLGADLFASPACYGDADCEVRRDELDGRDHEVRVGDEFAVGDLIVHVRAGDDPDAVGERTFVVEHASGTFFHGGDSRVADAFDGIGDEFDINLGVLAMGSVGRQYFPDADEWRTRKVYMDEDEVVEAANALELDRLAPSHHDMWKGVGVDTAVLSSHAASFEYPRVVEPIETGDRLTLDESGIAPPRDPN